MKRLPLILCIDDPEACEIMEILLAQLGFKVVSIQSAREALRLARMNPFSAVISEYLLDDLSAEQLCLELRKLDPELPVIFYSAESREMHRERGLSAGANAFLVKPNDLDNIEHTVLQLASR